MKKSCLLLALLFFFIVCNSYSQNGWFRQDSTAGTGWFDISFIDINTGLAVGANGKVGKTTNGGLNWSIITTGTSSVFRTVYLLNAMTGIIGGTISNTICKTTDGGATWNVMSVVGAPNGLITAIKMVNNNTGFASGSHSSPITGYVLKTTNSGNTWELSYSGAGTNFETLFCLDINNIFVAGTSVIRSFNGGSGWGVGAMPIHLIRDIEFVSPTKCFGAGDYYRISDNEPSILRSTDGGTSFLIYNYLTNERFHDTKFYDENNGFVVGTLGTILRTTNSGITWIRQNKIYPQLEGISFQGPNTATVVGFLVPSIGLIYHTTTGGWDIPLSPSLTSPANGSGPTSLNTHMRWSSVAYNAAVYRVQVSTDSNFSSTVIDAGSLDTTGYIAPNGVLAGNNTYFWRVRSENPFFNSSWSTVWRFHTNLPAAPNLVTPSNGDTGIASAPLFDWSDVGGVSGYRCQVATDSLFQNISIDSLNIAQSSFTATYGKLLHSTNYYWRANGRNISGEGAWSSVWKFKTSGKVPALIFPSSGDTGVVGRPLFDWNDYSSSTSYRIQVSTNPNFTTFAVNTGSIVPSQYQPGSNLTANTLYYWRVNASYSGGTSFWSNSGQFRTSVLVELSQISSIIPLENKLFENFPNPFNPQTIIKFDISKTSFTKIIVFDLLGKEIAVLVNQELNPGTYKAEWDASAFSSGVYFYKLTAGDYIQTKKMVLMK